MIQNYTAEYTGSSLKLSSPYRKTWLMIFGLSWMVIAATVFLSLSFLKIFAPQVTNLQIDFLLPSLIVLLPFGALALVELLWQLWGLEIAEVADDQITIKHQIFGIGISKDLYSQNIDGVFVSNQKNDWLTYITRDFKFLNFKKGRIAINCGKTFLGGVRTYRFGSILEREEAEQIVRLIHERFPQYKYRGKRKAG